MQMLSELRSTSLFKLVQSKLGNDEQISPDTEVKNQSSHERVSVLLFAAGLASNAKLQVRFNLILCLWYRSKLSPIVH